MSEHALAALIPSRPTLAPPERPAVPPKKPLPLAEVVALSRPGTLRYGMGRIDASGRVSDKSMLTILGWRPGQHLAITVVGAAVVVHPHPSGLFLVPAAQYVVLPAPVRRRCGFQRGDRVLLAADPVHRALVVHPMAALDSMITAYHGSLLGGGDHDGV